MTALRELAERWRAEAESFNAENIFACGRVSAKRNCADELLQILDAEGDGGAVGSVPSAIVELYECRRRGWNDSTPAYRAGWNDCLAAIKSQGESNV